MARVEITLFIGLKWILIIGNTWDETTTTVWHITVPYYVLLEKWITYRLISKKKRKHVTVSGSFCDLTSNNNSADFDHHNSKNDSIKYQPTNGLELIFYTYFQSI